ncbi:hypothetical protein DYB28_003009, partial [Aphanomyces astaci]
PLKFRLKDGSIKVVDAQIGTSILDVAHKYDIDLEGTRMIHPPHARRRIHVTLPLATRNFYVDGHVPKPH